MNPKLGPETLKSHQDRIDTFFYKCYMNGKEGLDIGYRGDVKDADPVLDTAIGIDLDYPGYDGINLPFESNSKDYVFSSHCLEHIDNPYQAIKEWHRVIKPGGYVIIIVPHMALYERKLTPPSNWNGDHKRFYTAGCLLKEIELALPLNTYRVTLCKDNDRGYDYQNPITKHPQGCYEIECVIRKINKPDWELE